MNEDGIHLTEEVLIGLKTCKSCKAILRLVRYGENKLSLKWVDTTGDWHCGHDPDLPFKAHMP